MSFPRWCKLRGNLLFYLKDQDPFSLPLGLIVLENCRPVIRSESRDVDGYSFFIGKLLNGASLLSTETAFLR